MLCNLVKFPQHGLVRVRRLCIGVLGMAAAQLLGSGAPAEFETKAAALSNFARFVDWPSQAFASDESPLTIGILGPDPFGILWQSTMERERVHGRPITVVHYRTLADVSNCHLLFISGVASPRTDEIMAALSGRPILTVCERGNPGADAAMFSFALAEGRVQLQVNLGATKAAGLAVSAKLLRSAQLVMGAESKP
jgi:hypothetical protein